MTEQNLWTGLSSSSVFSVLQSVSSHRKLLSFDQFPVCAGMFLVRSNHSAPQLRGSSLSAVPTSPALSSSSTSTGNRKSQSVSIPFIHLSTLVPISPPWEVLHISVPTRSESSGSHPSCLKRWTILHIQVFFHANEDLPQSQCALTSHKWLTQVHLANLN